MVTKENLQLAINKLKQDTDKKNINIEVIRINDELSITTSKLGGIPYIPKNIDVPVDSQGKQLALLAQINCSELPENDIYPKEGLVQFWIGRDDLLGLDFDNNISQKNSRVTYIKDIDETISKEEILTKYNLLNDEEDESVFEPLNTTLEIKFSEATNSYNIYDYDYLETLMATYNELFPEQKVESTEDIEDVYYDHFDDIELIGGSYIGGYPFFTQWDVRGDEKYRDYQILLLQIDSEGNYLSNEWTIMWGDCGVGNFFITKEQLDNLDFSKVLFNWDCH